MTSASSIILPFHSRRVSEPRLWVALGASALTHATALAVFVALVNPVLGQLRASRGEPAMVEVLLTKSEQREEAPQPNIVPDNAAPPPLADHDANPPQATAEAKWVAEPRDRVPPEDAPPRAEFDGPLAMAAAPAADAIAADGPTPSGHVAVGARTVEVLGNTQALRLAQRFPEVVANPPRLLEPLAVGYPPQAPRSQPDTRIAVLIIVDADGKILETTLFPDDALFGPAVRQAIGSAKFKPADVGSRSVPYWAILEFVFTAQPNAAARLPRSG